MRYDCLILLFTAGNILVGATDLTGRHWTGSLWYYEEGSQLQDQREDGGTLKVNQPSIKSALAASELEDGIGDALFVGDDGKDVRDTRIRKNITNP